jgi:tetratricopeptide (TPR) repeat protein
MHLDANEELERIDPDVRHVPEVLELRLIVYSGLEKWELMQVIAKKLAFYDPKNVQWTISWAYATRRADCIDTARRILLNALEAHPEEPVIPYNLACYAAQLGDLEEARRRLERAFQLEPNMREPALTDMDLEPFWRSYSGKLEDRPT